MENKFVETIEKEVAWKETENGQPALNTTFDACLDFFATAGALRTRSDSDIRQLFLKAYDENKLTAMKILFYIRDIEEGLGERRTFRVCLKWLAETHPEVVRLNLDNITAFGRYDDLYSLADTPCEKDAFNLMRDLFLTDIVNMTKNKPVSLLAKWLKSTNTSSSKSRALGRLTAKYFDLKEENYRKAVAQLRKYIDVTEVKMTDKKWSDIDYTKVPGNCMQKHTKAFYRNDEERFSQYIDAVKNNKTVIVNGKEVKAKINTQNLFPYEIVRDYEEVNGRVSSKVKPELEVMWNNLKDVVGDVEYNGIIICDTSGSMYGLPMQCATSLGIYFAQHNKGPYHNKLISFSNNPSWISLTDSSTLRDKLETIYNTDWGWTTNIKAVFDLVLKTAVDNNLSQEDLPKSLIIVTDMEFNDCNSDRKMTFYDAMKERYRRCNYELPHIIFWNVNARNNTFHATAQTPHVTFVSGSASNVFKDLVKGNIKFPLDYMNEVINKPRYNCVLVA